MVHPLLRAVVFDAGHMLLDMDYARLTAFLASRGHELGAARVIDAEQAAQATRERTGEGRYVQYLVEYLGITDDAERIATAEWWRGFNVPIGLCYQIDGEAAQALRSMP